ncbi:extracellular solute-binding protein [Aestuariivirga litoralis]|uniref:extracellular solute-binding protein n=1 Tax=Aestuariivirga litoralis TaxID=2650924 RepID=UPI0018C7CD77|nr:extracellular solute-binding protein [Aestuariivirga litoralis]MBG1231640.1 ABC transporter substrate-binding protein [Aestuariivirga litoralis]
MNKIRLSILSVIFLPLWISAGSAEPKTGIAMHGEPALAADFKSLPYANPDAPQGGTLRQALVGTFDSLNPFIVKGNAAQGARTYVFESLMGRNWGEPFSLYGLLAESIDVSDDRQTFTFKIRPEAKFSDGTPVTAADVQFSLETLRDHGRPNFKNNYGKISKIEVPDDHTITFHQDKGDRELPMIIGLMPVLPKAAWKDKDFEVSSLDAMVGSGPYMFGDIRAGDSVTFKKNPAYWGKNLAINKGLWNFDTLRFDYYKDANTAFEAFKKGEADIRIENDPIRWATGYDFPAAQNGDVKIETYFGKTPAPASGFAFNTRRPLFADQKVREALTMAFDFEWANANLLNKLDKRIYGYYSGSELSSAGKPADAAELAILGDGKAKLRADMLDGSYKLPVTDGSGHDRKVLRKAVDLLAEAGWKIGGNGLVNDKGEPFAFTIVVQSPDHEKLALHYQRTLQLIGIKAEVKRVDDTQFKQLQTSYDYDMIPATWYNSLSPGNEQTLYFASLGRDTTGTRNYPGIADPAIDHAIDAMLHATSQEDFQAAVRLEDRLLVAGFYIVPFFTSDQWVGRWKYIGSNPPDKQPLPGFEATTLWYQK